MLAAVHTNANTANSFSWYGFFDLFGVIIW